MVAPLMEPCANCHGMGTVPHEKRKMEDGEADPADFRVHELCPICIGSGKVPLDKKSVQEKPPGHIADMGSF